MMAICKNVILQAKGASKRKFLIAQSGTPASPVAPIQGDHSAEIEEPVEQGPTHFYCSDPGAAVLTI